MSPHERLCVVIMADGGRPGFKSRILQCSLRLYRLIRFVIADWAIDVFLFIMYLTIASVGKFLAYCARTKRIMPWSTYSVAKDLRLVDPYETLSLLHSNAI